MEMCFLQQVPTSCMFQQPCQLGTNCSNETLAICHPQTTVFPHRETNFSFKIKAIGCFWRITSQFSFARPVDPYHTLCPSWEEALKQQTALTPVWHHYKAALIQLGSTLASKRWWSLLESWQSWHCRLLGTILVLLPFNFSLLCLYFIAWRESWLTQEISSCIYNDNWCLWMDFWCPMLFS